ncbi:O-antigen ligase family protein [Planctomycetes bacterium K23_9]|uniref:O-Antigen ligase n=1 Tax=Stieleria marina TaxID=1930275 RepID=A0A517NSN2_9BACT|nr:O-Antigen ligase [Planctomycetes bacterium K23_9]
MSFSAKSNRRSEPQIAPNSQWVSLRILDAARLLLIAAIFVAVWGIGGYYPTARFVTLALLSAAAALVFLGGPKVETSPRNLAALSLIIVSGLLLGLIQLMPQSAFSLMEWSGVRDMQIRFGADPSDAGLTQSLVPWMTQSWLAMAVIGFAAFFLGSQLFNDDRSRIFLLVSIAICGVGQVLWGIAQLTTYPDMIFYGVENPSPGSVPFGTFLNRNHAADFIAVALACSLGVFRARSLSKAQQWRTGYGVTGQIQSMIASPLTLAISLGVLCLMLGLALSMSRGGWVSAFVAACVVSLCWKRAGKKRRVMPVIAAIIATTVVFFSLQLFGFGDQISNRVDDLDVEKVIADPRFDHWAEAIPAVQHFLPLGSGMGTYGYAYLPFEPEPESRWFTHAHNQYLEVLVEAGLPGIILVFLGLYVALHSCLSLCSNERSVSKQALGVAAMSAIVLHAFHALTDFGLMMPGNLIVLAALVGAACAAVDKRTPRKKRQLRSVTAATAESDPASSDPATKLPSKGLPPLGRLLSPTTMGVIVLLALCAALWQQGRHVSSTRVLKRTSFAMQTPSPTTQVSQEKIAALRGELQRWPAFEPVQRRIIRLETHHARRQVYDQIRTSEDPDAQQLDAIVAWNSTSLQVVIARLFDDSPGSADENTKQQIRDQMKNSAQLREAWDGLQNSLVLNPIQPRTHLQIALLAAATGRSWREPFDRSMKLSVVNTDQTLGNGLLAWAANDKQSMIQQWKQNLSTNTDSIELIYQLAKVRLNEDAIVKDLMPKRWVVPFRLSQLLRQQEGTDEVREKLLRRSEEIAEASIAEPSSLYKTLGMIATARDDLSAASEHYDKAIKSNPGNAHLRHLAAVALYRQGDAKHAVQQARRAKDLEPKNAEYRKFFQQATKLHRQQYSNSQLLNDSSRSQPE